MTWTWTAPVGVKLVLILAVIVCRFFRPPHPPTLLENIIHTTVFLAAFWTFWGSIIEYLVVSSLSVTRVVLRMDLVPQYGNMFLVVAASCWLLYRSLQTMRIPVGDLIDILKVDVPEAPDVNGVNVGNSGPQDTAITVTGLKPAHFYNIRVIAVGSNNFQSGSSVIRLRTYGKDSKPRLTNGRLPPSFLDQEQHRRREDEPDGDNELPRSPLPSIEAAPALDGSSSRDSGPPVTSNRRNTVSRRHSPSVASLDRPTPKDAGSGSTETQESLAELNEKFQRIRKEISDTVAQYEREEGEFKVQEDQLRKDLERKRQVLKEKESNTEQLRKRVNITGEQMRAAEKERAKKEQLLKDKQAKLQNTRDRIAKLESETESMRSKRDGFTVKKAELDEFKKSQLADLEKDNSVLQEECSRLEAELKEKGKMLKELKLERQKLPGGDADERWRETDIQLRREWETRRKMLEQRILAEMQRRHDLTANVRMLHNLIEQYRSHQSTLANAYIQGKPPGLDFVDPSQHPYVDDSTTADSFGHDQSFSSVRVSSLTAGAPLSPTATSLIPAGILGDDDLPPSPSSEHFQSPFGRPMSANLLEADPQSPASSNRSLSLMSSPQGSSQHLPFPPFPSEPGDRRSGALTSSPTAPDVQPSRFTSLWSPFQRARGAGKTTDELGPPLGTLKPGQSRSFPRQIDDWDAASNKRKTGLAGSLFNRNSVHILDDEDLLDPQVSPSQVGVIGSRPPASSLIAQRLNPKAPTFMAGLFRKEGKEKADAKGKPKDKGKEKEKDKASISGASQSTDQISHLTADDSPSDSRKSRDTFSVHTQTSVSESRESLNLDGTWSSTPSEPSMGPSSSLKEQDNVVKKLFRKGSSSRFNLTSRLGKDSALFKKGPGSTANSDKNIPADRSSVGDIDDIGDDGAMLGRSLDSVTSSPSLGPAKSREREKEGRMNTWRFSMKKKGKDAKESLDLDRKGSLSLDSEVALSDEKK
ncbi:unnamed protein product [Parascedosporium putredinis]|uniref:Fibronectin type-III domain-containing protein n=1 Tax=Parascedosporium putredinis TaxID=1442378 RepID=A0A9P1HAJ4_9PEZI|nr:unnamed protein product [Parascedosporium putredinis]CAI8002138.1 unnamed protein product [Parascedosporium putredinis]